MFGFWMESKNHTFYSIIFSFLKPSKIQTKCPWLNTINKNLSSEKFCDKNLRILNPPIFFRKSEKFSDKIFWCSGWSDFSKFSSEYFDRNTFWKSLEIVRILRIFFVDRIEPRFWTQKCLKTKFMITNLFENWKRRFWFLRWIRYLCFQILDPHLSDSEKLIPLWKWLKQLFHTVGIRRRNIWITELLS